MKNNLLWTVLLISLCQFANAQDTPVVSCGQKEVTDKFLRENPIAKRLHDQIELQVADYTRKVKSGQIPAQRTNAVVTLPVVVHIIHNNGPENISDATAMAAIQHLNEAFANTGFYDPANGVNTQIQFCLAQRDPSGNATNGITRNVSPYTVMSGSYTSDDQHVKNLNRWNPNCYINIWLVREIPGGVAGYAYLPSAHGGNLDGIVMEAAYFGSSHANDVVIIHEMGHYLGLYHTFEGACNNNDCTTDGDRICDTPPDQSTGYAACNTSVNSCSTDPLSGFATDVNDLKEDYMDYGNFNCMKVFTQGQADRMNWIIQNVRKSLLNCNSCLSPCPAPVTANFTASGTNVPYGTTVNFTNSSTNASGYRWYVNGTLQATSANFSYTFNAGGTFIIRLVALPGSPLCDSVAIQKSVNVICTAPVTANFTSTATNVLVGTTVNFTNNSVNANSYRWYINGTMQSTTTNYSYTFNTGGLYVVRLVAMSNSPICDSMAVQDTIRVNCGVTANFSPLISTAITNQTINFTNSSLNATSYQWLVNGTLQGTGTNFSYSFSSSGNHTIKLRAIGAACTDSIIGTVVIEDTCTRHTFQKTFGGPGNDMATDVRLAADGGFIIAGRTTSFSAGGEDGLILKTDEGGNIQWSKTFGGTSNDWFNRVIAASDGGYLAVGRTYSFGNTTGDAWIVKVDAGGGLQWSRRLSGGTVNGEEAFSVVQTPDGGYAVCGTRNSAPGVVDILVAKFDLNGNLLWHRIYNTGGTDGGLDISLDGNDLMIGGFTRTSISYHDGLLMKLSGVDGTIVWTKQYEIEGLNNVVSQVFKHGNGFIAEMGTIRDFSNVRTGRGYAAYLDANGNLLSLIRIMAPNYEGMGGRSIPFEDGSFAFLHNEDNDTESDFNIFKISRDGTVQWAKKYPRAGIQKNSMFRLTRDGGFVSVGYTGAAGSYDIYMVKTDALGNSPGCETSSVPITTQAPQGSTYDGNWSSNVGITPNPVQGIGRDESFTITELCQGSTCDVEPPVDDDTCNQRSSYQKRYGGTQHDNAYDLVKTKDGGYLIAGSYSAAAAGSSDGYAVKFDRRGQVEWAKTYGGAGEDMFQKVRQTADGGYIFGGYTRSYGHQPGEGWIVKTDATGNVQWSRQYGNRNPNGERIFDLIQTSDGGYAFAGDHQYTPGTVDGMVVRLDASGNVIWARGYGTSGSDELLGILEDRDTLVVTAFYQTGTGYDVVLMKLNKNNGDVIWTKAWDFDNRTNRVGQIFFQADGYLIGGVNSDGYDVTNPYQNVIKTDHNGNLVFVKELRTTPITMNGYLAPTRDGGFVTETMESIFDAGANIFITKSDRSGNVLWSKRYDNPGKQTESGLIQANDGVFIAAATTNAGGSNDLLIIRTDTAGNTEGCNSTTITAQNRNPVVNPQPNFSWTRLYAITINANQVVNPATNVIVTSVVSQCENIPCETPPDDDTCAERKNFIRTIGGNGNDEGIDIITTPDGGNLIAGSSNSNTGSNIDALIVKTGSSGEVEWSKTYGGVGADVFNKIIRTRDGNYVAVGSGSFKVGHLSDVFIIKINPQGNIIWSKAYGAGTLNGEVGRSVVETDDGGFAIAADYNTAPTTVQPLYLKVDMNGVLLWSKLLNVAGTGQAYDIVTQGDVLIGTGVVAKTGGLSTLNDGYIIKLNSSDGGIRWTRNIESEGRSNRLQQLKLYNNELVFTMYNADAFTTNNCLPVIFKTDTSGNVTFSRRIDLLGVNKQLLSFYSQPTPDGGFITTLNDQQNNGVPRIGKLGFDGNMQWVRNYTSFPQQALGNIIANNSGFVSAGRVSKLAGGNTDILYIKTTSAGIISDDATNCPITSTDANSASIQIQSTIHGANYWSAINNGNLEMLNAAPNVIAALLPSETLCIDSLDCELPPDDTCALLTFQKTYTANGGYNAFYIHTTADGGSVIAGTGNPVSGDINPVSTNIDAMVMKLARNGNLEWAKRIGGAGYDEFRKIKPTSDGGFIAIGSSSSFGSYRGIYLVRLNASGAVTWSKNFSANAVNNDLGLDVVQTSDGGFVFTATNDAAPPVAHGIVAKTDANGNITWHKRLYRSDGVDIHSVVENADTLVLGADYWVAAEQRYYGAIIKMNKSNGSIISSIGIAADTRGSFATHLFKTATGFMAGIHLITGASYNDKQQVILRFDQNLRLETASRILGADINPWSDITPTLDSGFIATAGRYAFGNSFYLNKANKSDVFDFNKRFGSQPGMSIIMQTAANAQQYSNGAFITACTYNEPITGFDGKIHVIKTTAQGTTPGCIYLEGAATLENINVIINPVTWTDITTFNYNSATAVNSMVTNVDMVVKEHCDPECAIDTLIGPDSICILADTITYELKRKGDCAGPVEWTIDPDFANIISTTDTTVRLQFKKSGKVILYARINSACYLLSDSITIDIFDLTDTLDLGPDIQLCKISTWPLNAGSGFRSYLWQDGSTDSTFTVTEPGIYHVTVTDFCGNQLRDTVIVSLAPDVPFDLGPDIAICDKDTVTITAPSGFTNYYWSPGYRMSDSYNPTIKVYTDRDTTYTVVAEKSPGCLVTDTIRVIVRRPTPLDLGADTMFCRKDSVLLDAGPAFSSYLWSNSATTQQIYATTGGNYHVTATDINGCVSRDTIDVLMNEIPDVDLGPDTLLCRNTAVYFQPRVANALSTYLWQDGSTQPHHYADRPGVYWVEVTNRENCKSRDTVEILGFSEPPTDFLADTIGVCDGEPIELRANGNFASYRWDNAITTATIMVDRPGIHSLAVTDANGCSGLDSIRVYAKNCVKQIFFPNSFTPNNDGRHDIWKPVVRGKLVKFHLVIYNRWGGKVYETYDATRGWNGTINHLQQSTNAFVWACTYQFIGDDQVEHKEKGMLMLVR